MKKFEKFSLLLFSLLFSFNFEKQIRFAQITDVHIHEQKKCLNVVRKFIKDANNKNLEFVVSTGDLVFDANRASKKRAEELFSLYKKEFSNLEMPLYNTIGNHDLCFAAEHYKAIYRKFFDTYYSFDYAKWHFIVVDPFSENRKKWNYLDDEQIKWLENDLEKNKNKKIIFFCHIPLHECGNYKKFLAVAKKYKIKAIISGHKRENKIFYKDGMLNISTAALSGNWWGKNKNVYGYRIFTLDDKIESKYIEIN